MDKLEGYNRTRIPRIPLHSVTSRCMVACGLRPEAGATGIWVRFRSFVERKGRIGDIMGHPKPKFSKAQVDEAGKQLVGLSSASNYLAGIHEPPRDLARALDVVNNWRSSHRYALFLAHENLRNQAANIDPNALTADRIKRLASIEAKLRMQPRM
jgi:hypothetical protein